MKRAFTPKLVTANHLISGDVIYRRADGHWTPDLACAELVDTQALAELRLIEADAEAHIAVGAYLADANAGATGPAPVHFRETFRARGPSNYPHGKQEGGRHAG